MLTGDVFDETTWQQLPAEVRDNLAREVTSDEAFAQLLEGSSWNAIETNLQLLFEAFDGATIQSSGVSGTPTE